MSTKKSRSFARHASNKTITILLAKSQAPKKVKLSNVSMGGLSFKLDQKLNIGDSLYVLSTSPIQPQPIDAEVVWVKKLAKAYTIGVEFHDEHYATRAAIIGSMITG